MRPPNRFHYVAVFGVLVWAIGIFVISGFVLHQPWMQNWVGDTPMSIEAALCFVACGFSIFVLAAPHAGIGQ